MNQKIAYCGYDCTNCPIYQASIKNDIELLKIISYASIDVDINTIKCLGCSKENNNKYCSKCPIRLCASTKSIENCGHCKEFPCDKLNSISPQTYQYLDDTNKRLYKNSIDKALEIATKAHKGQVDKAGVDYIIHPITVSKLCQTKEAKIVGLLHDVVEDTNVTLKDLEEFFSSDIIEAIRLVTKTEGFNIDEYYQNIKNNKIAKEVKLADLTHNMDLSRFNNQDLTEKDLKRKEKYQKYYEYLSN